MKAIAKYLTVVPFGLQCGFDFWWPLTPLNSSSLLVCIHFKLPVAYDNKEIFYATCFKLELVDKALLKWNL